MVGPIIHPDEKEQHVWSQDWKSAKNVRKLEILAIQRNFGMKTLFLLSYLIYLFNFE
jgi:hypothetical protein